MAWGPQAPVTAQPKWKVVIRWVLLIPIVILLAALLLPALGAGARVNLGGLIGMLLGLSKPKGRKSVAIANTIPEKRTTEINLPDLKGYKQIPASELQISKNPFRDRSVVKTEDEVIELPEGVHDTDVEKVILVGAESAVVTVKNMSDLRLPMQRTPREIAEELRKLRGQKT